MKYKIAVFPGDGVGPELINEGIKVVEKAAELDKFEIGWLKNETLTDKTLKEISISCNAVYCGTFDNLKAGSENTERSIPQEIRNYFDQFVCLRPIKLLQGVESPLNGKTPDEINFVIIRENTEDFYIGASGKAKNGKNRHQLDINNSVFKAKFGINIEAKGSEIAYQIGILSRKGCERIIRYAFDYAKIRNIKKIVSVDKVNKMESYNFWRESINNIAKEYQGIAYEFNLVDTAVVNFIRQPEKYGIVVAPNMFGDILADLGTMLQGGLSFAARGNLNPEGISMFEPAHGSAPKLKDKGIVNPIATIWAGALMLDTIGQQKSSNLIIKAIESVLKEGRTRTQDLNGNNTTSEMGDAIVDKMVEIYE